MLGSSHAFEQMCFVFVCENRLLDRIQPSFFQNKYVQTLCLITKQFYKRFKELPFAIGSESTDQLEKIVDKNKKVLAINEDLSEEENLKNFLINSRAILNTDLTKYSKEYLNEVCKAWIMWQNSQEGYREAIEYQRTQEINPENVLGIIKKAKELVIRGSSISFDDDLGEDFYEANSHKPPDPKALAKTGFQYFDRWSTDVEGSGGLEPGTLTILAGYSNVGKSIILQNLAQNLSINGYNVFMPSLEMATWKIFKRMGSNAFDIPINQYSNFAMHPDQVELAIREFKKKHHTEFQPIGMLKSKRYSTATPEDIRNTALKIEDTTGEKIHVVVTDYMTEFTSASGISWSDKSYYLHKESANTMHRHAVDHEWSEVTAHQFKDDANGASDVTLNMFSESKGMIHKPDNIYGIIQTPEMKVNRKFYLKNLKARDSQYKDYFIHFDIDYSKMRITEKGMLEPGSILV